MIQLGAAVPRRFRQPEALTGVLVIGGLLLLEALAQFELVSPILLRAPTAVFGELLVSAGSESIRADAFVDGNGYEALTFRRSFDTEPRRRFVDTFRWNPDRKCVTNLFGNEGRVVADLYPTVEDGALRLEVGDQWLRTWEYHALPEPLWVDAVARDWYDEGAGRYRIGATITNPLVGHVFGYTGVFDVEREAPSDERASHPTVRRIDLPDEDH